MIEAIYHFPIDGTPVSCQQIKSGHINRTYLITTDTGTKYILQWVNRYVFPNVDAIMNNMTAISTYLQQRENGRMPMISYIDTVDGHNYYSDSEDGCWRSYRFVDDSICLHYAENPEDFYQSARAFGNFQNALNDFPAEQLEETIENFHNTPDRYSKLYKAVKSDSYGRLQEVEAELKFIMDREEQGCVLHKMRMSGELPTRVTHNDTKISNVLLHKDTRKPVCVIDLDTVMPGLSAYDFGDAIRYGASTATEDETDLSKVSIDLDFYRAFVRGFIEACPALTDREIEMLPRGAYVLTLENAIRFLTDYLKGDKYFSIDREKHNLDRCRTQLKLLSDMELKWEQMEQIVREEAKAIRG